MRRLLSCIEKWPECESFGYDPRCCRFPKSCSCEHEVDQYVTDEMLEPEKLSASDERDISGLSQKELWGAAVPSDPTTPPLVLDEMRRLVDSATRLNVHNQIENGMREAARRDLEERARTWIPQLIAEIERLRAEVGVPSVPEVETLRDERNEALAELHEANRWLWLAREQGFVPNSGVEPSVEQIEAVWIYEDENGIQTAYPNEEVMLANLPFTPKLPERDVVGRPMNGRVPWHMMSDTEGWKIDRVALVAAWSVRGDAEETK